MKRIFIKKISPIVLSLVFIGNLTAAFPFYGSAENTNGLELAWRADKDSAKPGEQLTFTLSLVNYDESMSEIDGIQVNVPLGDVPVTYKNGSAKCASEETAGLRSEIDYNTHTDAIVYVAYSVNDDRLLAKGTEDLFQFTVTVDHDAPLGELDLTANMIVIYSGRDIQKFSYTDSPVFIVDREISLLLNGGEPADKYDSPVTVSFSGAGNTTATISANGGAPVPIANGSTVSESGTYTVTVTDVTGRNKSATFRILRVQDIVSILISGNYKTVYIEGQTFDPTGMIVTAVYKTGDTEVVSRYTVTPQPLQLGTTKVTVSYVGKSADVTVQVVEDTGVPQFIWRTDKKYARPGEEVTYTLSVVNYPDKSIGGIQINTFLDSIQASYKDNSVVPLFDSATGFWNKHNSNNEVVFIYEDATGLIGLSTANGDIFKFTVIIDGSADGALSLASRIKFFYKIQSWWIEPADVFSEPVMIVTSTPDLKINGADAVPKYHESAVITFSGAGASAVISKDGGAFEAFASGLEVNLCGTYTVIVTDTIGLQKIAVFNIVNPYIVTGISVSGDFRKSYVEGQNFDDTGMVVTAHYSGGASAPVTNYDIAPEKLTLGMTKVTISYGGKSTDVAVTVKQKTLSSISVTTPPHKTVYIEGEEFDKTGMVVTAFYDNGDSEPVEGYNWTPEVMALGTTKVTVFYGGKSAEVNVTVNAKTLMGISVISQPSKTEYIEGQPFEAAGMTVAAFYDNGTIEFLTNQYTISPSELTLGTTKVTVHYGGKTADISVQVNPKSVAGISIKREPDKTAYFIGETFEVSGLVILVTYDNGKAKEMVVTANQVSGFNSSSRGEKTLLITYGDFSCPFTITVSSILGDVDGNGKVDVGDIVFVRDYILGKRSLSEAELASADVNQQDGVDVADIVMIRDHILGKALLH